MSRIRVFISTDGSPGDPSSWNPVEITQWVDEPVVITRGKASEDGTAGPSSCQLTVRNDDGRFSPRNPLGPWYGKLRRNTPIWVYWDDTSNQRFFGHVSEWPTRWLGVADVSRTPIRADGVLRRLERGAQALGSPLARWVPSQENVVAYWPLEDEGGGFASPIGGVPGGHANGSVEFASVEKVGSRPLPRVGGQTSGQIVLPVPRFTLVDDGWRIDWLFRMDDVPDQVRGSLRIETNSTAAARWELQFTDTPNFQVQAFDSDGISVETNSETLDERAIGNWLHLSLRVVLSGSIAYEATVRLLDTADLQPVELHSLSDFVTGTNVGRPTRLRVGPIADQPRAYGHVTVCSSDLADPFAFGAANGFPGETAGQRIIRLCGEEGVPVTVAGDADDTMPMGPQPVDTLTNILRECEAADGGDLHDQDPSGPGLVYVTRTAKQNQPVTMNLTCDDVLSDPEPTDDDRFLRNQVTVSRPGGSSATATDEDSIRSEGHYPTALSINVASDRRLRHVASWHKGRATVDEMRWPQIAFNPLRNEESRLSDWLGLRIGDRITVDNEWPQIPGVEVDQIVEGWSEQLREEHVRVDLNCSPAAPWNNILTVGDPDLGRVAFRAYLAEDIDDEQTSFDVVIPVRRAMNPYSTFEDDFPIVSGADNDGWRTLNLASLARSSEQAFRGFSSGKGVPDGVSELGQISGFSPAAQGTATYRASAWVLAPSGTVEARVRLEFRSSPLTVLSSVTGPYTEVGDTEWTRLTVSGTQHAATRFAFIVVQWRVTGGGSDLTASDVLYVDEAEVGRESGGLATADVFPVDMKLGGEVITVSAVGAMSAGLQEITCTRGVNGITKPHQAGTDVVLYPLPRLGLGN